MRRLFSGEGFVGMMLVVLLALFLIAPAFAGGDKDCPYGHQHQGSCQGPPGEDGKDGKDGVDGKDGRDGIDGVVDYQRINTTVHKEFRTWRNYAAAMQAIQIHLPQDSSQRLTASGSYIDGASGVGLGYAYKFDRDDNLAITAGIGSSGGEEVGVLSLGLEFGADRNALRNTQHYDDRQLNQRLDALEQDFRRQRAVWDESAKRCASDLDRAEQKSDVIEERFMECLRK